MVLLVLSALPGMGWPPEAGAAATSTAGERVFVNFAGHTMAVIDGATGEVRRAEIFVAVLGPRATPLRKRSGRNRCLTGLPCTST